MIDIPIPPDRDSLDEVILSHICERLVSVQDSTKKYHDPFKRYINYEGILSWKVIDKLKHAGYLVIPQHGVGIPANDWKEHIDSIYYWSIWW